MLTREEAVALYEAKFWEGMSYEEKARFQIHEERLCMPFDVFHEAVEEAIGRPVWTHEFARMDLLRAELDGDRSPPTLEEIVNLIPEEKRVIVVLRGERE